MRNLRVNGERLWASLMEMAKIGALPKGGCGRLALSDEDKAGRDLFVSWCKAAGCTIRMDALGNIFARREGRNPALPPVMTGSHLDTQPHGGKFDGVLGVLAGLEVIRSLNDAKIVTDAPVEVACWTNEEGARFTPAMCASGVFGGAFTADYVLAQTDLSGKTFGDELKRIGYAGSEPCGGRPIGAFFELHIEQGPILEAEKLPIGVVTGVQGVRWYDVVVSGQDAHAGPTPMDMRRDALLAAARMVNAVNREARARAPYGRGTVGQMQVVPNSRNTVPGEIKFTVDLRHPEKPALDGLEAAVKAAFDDIARQLRVAVSFARIWDSPPTAFAEAPVAAVREAAKALGYAHRDIVSGAGHDSVYISRVAPTAMIFIPCKGGLSHNEEETAEPEHVTQGANVLLQAMIARAG
ncbi:MAG: Zn-dependent hydrolase [Alphaproteobacteria bacterium]|nr:Zn-dependent hydrolase [Alphaproteobacteria bacterium]